MMEEIWKDIPGYEGLYQVSNLGNVRSLNYNHTNATKNIIPGKSTSGYLHVSLVKDKRKKTVPVAKCVWEAFKGLIPEGMQINHISEDKTNNRLDNLNLMTPKDNINWGTHNIRVSSTKRNGKGSIPITQKNLEGAIIKTFKSLNEASRQTGINLSGIWLVCNGKRSHAGGFRWEYEKREAV